MSDEIAPTPPESNVSDGQKMVKATAGIGAFVAVGSALTGLITKMFLSRILGTGAIADAYNYVYGLTQSVFRSWDKLVRPVMLPVLAQERARVGEKDSWRFVSSFFNIQAVAIALVVVATMTFAPWIVHALTEFKKEDVGLTDVLSGRFLLPASPAAAAPWMAHALAEVRNHQADLAEALAGRYLLFMAPAILFLALASTGYLLLNSYKRFQLAAFGDNVFVKLVPLVALLGLYGFFGIYALIFGVVLGAFAKLALYAWGLRRELRDFVLRIDFASPAMKHVWWLMVPLSVGVVGAFARDIIERWFMTNAGGGVVTIVTYSRAPVDVPIQIVPVALSIAIFPFLSDYVARNRHEQVFDLLGRAFRIVSLVFLPLTVAMVLLARPVADVVFGGGKFTSEDVRQTAEAVRWYALGYLFFGLEIVMLQFFYARRDTITPTWTGILTSALQIGILWAAVDAMGTSTFNMAYSASKAVKVLILGVMLPQAFPHEHLWRELLRRTLPAVGKVLLVTVVMGGVVWSLNHVLPGGRSLRGLLNLAVTCSAGGIVFVAGVHFLRVEEWHDALGWVKAKIKRS